MASPLDSALLAQLDRLIERLASYLPSDYAVMCWMYNRTGEHLDVTSFASNEASTGEVLRVLRATASQLIKRDAREGKQGEERFFGTGEHGSRSEQLVSSVVVTRSGAHDRVRLWNRGGLAGELVVEAGDGERLAQLLMLEERT